MSGAIAQIATLVVTALVSQAPEPPTIAPVFSEHRAASFLVQCRNSSSKALPNSALTWIGAYRLDGIVPPPGVVGGPGPAPPVPGEDPDRSLIPPGQNWQGFLVLLPPAASVRGGSTVLALSSKIFSHRLTAGRHTIAVQCFDTWSDDLVFYWDRDASY